jgi:transposase
MGTGNFSDDFKRDAVAQITERGYRVSEVSQRLGVSQHSLYAWKKKFSKPSVSGDTDQAAEIRRLKAGLARVTEERDILKRATTLTAPEMIRLRDVRFSQMCSESGPTASGPHDEIVVSPKEDTHGGGAGNKAL